MYKEKYTDAIVSITFSDMPEQNTVTFLIEGTRTFTRDEAAVLQKQVRDQSLAIQAGEVLDFIPE